MVDWDEKQVEGETIDYVVAHLNSMGTMVIKGIVELTGFCLLSWKP